MEILGQLLEWSPFVLVLDGALDRVLQQGIKVDAVLGDFDSINVQRLSVEGEQKIEWIHTPDQQKTDFDKGLDFLINQGHQAVNIVWATGKRLDHTYNNLISLGRYSGKLELVMIDDHSRIFALPKSFRKYYPAGSQISIMPLTDVLNIKTTGLKYNLNNEDFILPTRTGSSNFVESSGIVSVEYSDGVLCLMECYDSI